MGRRRRKKKSGIREPQHAPDMKVVAEEVSFFDPRVLGTGPDVAEAWYACRECGGVIRTRRGDSGVVLLSWPCVEGRCKGSMFWTQQRRLMDWPSEPSHEWVRPSEADIADAEIRNLALHNHFMLQGLLLRRIA